MSAYYNEFEPKAAAWLRELIAAKLIPAGQVDERSICEVAPNDIRGFSQCHFFAGVAGWSLALQLAGWPEDRTVWTGSCPCQPYSEAGNKSGDADARNLWPELSRLIRACNPPVVFGEQVASAAVLGGISKPSKRRAEAAPGPVWLDGIFADLESAHYACGASDIPAAGIGAPHIRQRCYWVADSQNSDRRREQQPGESTADGRRGFAGDSELGGLADMQRPRLEGQPRNGDDRDEPGRNGADEARPASASGGAGRMVLANGAGPQQSKQASATAGHGDSAESTGGGPWDDFRIIQCRDGKARRIPGIPQPGLQSLADVLPDDMDEGWRQSDGSIFPLAKGVQGRTGLLRGAGNAIAPYLAAEFIGAYLDTKGGSLT